MIDVVTSISLKRDEQNYKIDLFGSIDEVNRKIVLNYELNCVPNGKLEFADFMAPLRDFLVKSTDAKIYGVYGCYFDEHTVHFSSFGMGALKGEFSSLIRQFPQVQNYQSVSFSFDCISNVFRLNPINIFDDENNHSVSYTISRGFEQEYSVNSDMKCSVQSVYSNFPLTSCNELHISQKKKIVLSFASDKTISELMTIMWKIKSYIEFLLSQEIQLSDISFSNNSAILSSDVISDPILLTNTSIKPIKKQLYSFSIEDFANGLKGWMEQYDRIRRVIQIWQKTIYNSKVSEEDIFLWRCQAFEHLCEIENTIKSDAFLQLAQDQNYPNLRNYLISVSNIYGIAVDSKDYFMDVKKVRDSLTHNNPDKLVSEKQFRNSFVLMEYYLKATVSKIVGFKCNLPCLMFVCTDKNL